MFKIVELGYFKDKYLYLMFLFIFIFFEIVIIFLMLICMYIYIDKFLNFIYGKIFFINVYVINYIFLNIG